MTNILEIQRERSFAAMTREGSGGEGVPREHCWFGIEAITDEDRAYGGSRFCDVREALRTAFA